MLKKSNRGNPRRDKTKSPGFKLPQKKSEPSTNINDYSFLIYGRKKIGKTSLWGRRDNTLFFLFEPGAKAQSIYKVPEKGDCFTDWKQVKGYVKALNVNAHDFETVVFDTGRPAYDLCLDYYCKQAGIKHPGKVNDYGASWAGVAEEFKNLHLRVAQAGMGFVVIAHEKIEDFTAEDGKDYTRLSPQFSKSCNEFYEGVIDVIGHYGYQGKDRFLQIRGDEFTVAGCRIEDHFLTVKGYKFYKDFKRTDINSSEYLELADAVGKEQIFRIPMGNNADVSHRNFMDAFNNKQTETFKILKEVEEPKKERLNKTNKIKSKKTSLKRIKK